MLSRALAGASAATAVRMNPACAMDEYASKRFTSVWVTPTIAPTDIVMMAMAHMTGRQSQVRPPNATKNTRNRAPKAAIFVHLK